MVSPKPEKRLRNLAGAVEIRQLGVTADRLPRTRPVYRQIVQVLEGKIADGSLVPGVRLPPERLLADALDLSRATIVQAYRELESRGLVRRYTGRGTFVSAAPDSSGAPFAWRGRVAVAALRGSDSVIRDLVHQSTDPSLLCSGAGVPALERFPVEAFRRSLDRVLRQHGHAVWAHASTEGLPALREAIAERIGGHPEKILVLAGAQQGLDLLARCLIDPGDTVIVDRPGYLGALHTFRAAGARLAGWDVTRHDLDELEDLLVRYRPKLIYTNPTFHNPTGWTMPIRLRRDFLELATRLRVPIIEDDTYRDLSLGTTPPPPSLHELDSQSVVIHLNTFSKVLAPGLRLGWLSAAEPIVDQLTLIKQGADPHTHTLVQHIVTDMIVDGTYDRHLVELRGEHLRRRDGLDAALRRHMHGDLLRWSVPQGGLYFWCRLPGRVSTAAVAAAARREAVTFAAGQLFYPDHAGDRELRLCFSSLPLSRAEDVATRLARSIAAVRRDIGAPAPMLEVVRRNS
jgi:DNA-binding transcriptional MocR family regulator